MGYKEISKDTKNKPKIKKYRLKTKQQLIKKKEKNLKQQITKKKVKNFKQQQITKKKVKNFKQQQIIKKKLINKHQNLKKEKNIKQTPELLKLKILKNFLSYLNDIKLQYIIKKKLKNLKNKTKYINLNESILNYFFLLFFKSKINKLKLNKIVNQFILNFKPIFYYNWTLKFKIASIMIKKTKSNYFITVLDEWTQNTIYKISGGYAYQIGAPLNKKKANHKKQKYKTTLILKRKNKEFKKTSLFALEYMLNQTFTQILKKKYTSLNLIINGWVTSRLFNSLHFHWKKFYTLYFKLENIILDPKLAHNGMRGKKLRRI